MSQARLQSALALGAIGALAGGIGAAGVGAGLAAAEVLARSRRTLALVLCGGAAGALVALFAHTLLQALLEGLVGVHFSYSGGALDGLILGAAAGAGYGLATRQPPGGGLAAPSGVARLKAAVLTGASCAVAGALLALAGRLLVGGIVHDVAQSSREAQLVLAPLGHLIGEPDFGPMTRAILSACCCARWNDMTLLSPASSQPSAMLKRLGDPASALHVPGSASHRRRPRPGATPPPRARARSAG